MAIYESIGFGSILRLCKKELEPFEYIAEIKPMKLPSGTDIEEYKRKQAPYCLSGKVQADKKGTYRRNNDSLLYRDLIFLDYDEIAISPTEFKETVSRALFGYSYIIYPTIKHTAENPRYRLVVKPSDVMNEPSYKKVVKEIADKIGLPFDTASLTWSQLQGLPVTQGDVEFYDKTVERGLAYPVLKTVESHTTKARAAPAYSPNTSNQSITMRVINTLLNGFGDEGGRNVAVTRFVGMLIGKYVRSDVVTAWELTQIANSVTADPLPQEELERTFESIVKTEIRKRGLGLSN